MRTEAQIRKHDMSERHKSDGPINKGAVTLSSGSRVEFAEIGMVQPINSWELDDLSQA